MSKIDDAVSTIKNIIRSNDHSDSSQLRSAAEVYAAGCRECAAVLNECKKLFEQNLDIEAQKIANQLKPTLFERISRLRLDEYTHKKFLELCGLYYYQLPPELDISTLQQLTDSAHNKELNTLINRWRRIARTASYPEKISLLRKLIAASSGRDLLWRNNLQAIEKQWITDLLTTADSALQNKDYEKLTNVYMLLTDPELLESVPADLLKKYQPGVRQYQIAELKNQLQAKVQELFSAYSNLYYEVMAEKLREYRNLTTHPLYQADPATEKSVSEIEKYLQEYQSRCSRENIFNQKVQILQQELDRHSDFSVIENIYESLLQLDMPLDKNLYQRVANRRNEYNQENSRRHLRQCIYGILIAVILLAVGAVGFNAMQKYRSSRQYCQDMEKLLQEHNYSGAIALYEQINSSDPLLLQFGKLTALKLKAEQLMQSQQTKIEQINQLCNTAEDILQKPTPNISLLRDTIREIEDLKKALPLESDLSKRCMNAAMELQKLEFAHQQFVDKKFSDQVNELMKKFKQYTQQLQQDNCDIEQLKKTIFQSIEEASNIIKNPAGVSEDLFKKQSNLLQKQISMLQKLSADTEIRHKLQQQLIAPNSFQNYCEALAKIPLQAPIMSTGIWKKPLAQLKYTQALAAGLQLDCYNTTRDILDKFLLDSPVNMKNNNHISDLDKLLPDRYFSEKLDQKIRELTDRYSVIYNCYELVFEDSSGMRWYFYSPETPILDKSRSSRIPKALGMQLMLNPGAEGEFIAFKIKAQPDNRIVYIPGKVRGLALPAEFTELRNVKLSTGQIPPAAHWTVLNDTLHLLKHCKTPDDLENILMQALKKLLQQKNMNTFARAALIRQLLDILPLSSVFYADLINPYSVELDRIALNLYDRWFQPTIEAEFAVKTAELQKFFSSFAPEELQKQCQYIRNIYRLSLSRSLTPAGILLQDKNNQYQLHWFDGINDFDEIWVYTSPDSTGPSGWKVLNETMLSQMSRQLYHGEVFFVPFDNRKTSELADQYRQTLQKAHLPVTQWPQSWPLNIR